MGTAKVKSGSKEGKVQYPYDAMVYINGTVIRAIDKDGNIIHRGVAGTDDAAVIQAAIDSLTNGGIVKLSPHTFYVSTTIILGHGIYFCGSTGHPGFSEGTVLKLSDGSNTTVISGTSLNFCSIVNMNIDGNKSNNPTGGYGIYLEGGLCNTINNVSVRNTHDRFIYITTGSMYVLSNVLCEITDATEGIRLYDVPTATLLGVVSQNTSKYGFNIHSCSGIKMIGCWVEACTDPLRVFESTYCCFDSCRFVSSTGAAGTAIDMTGGNRNITFINVICTGIFIVWGSATTVIGTYASSWTVYTTSGGYNRIINSNYVHISEIRDALDNILEKLGTPRLLCPCNATTGTSITDYTRNSNTLTAQASVATWYGYQGRATYYDFDGAAKYLYRTNDTDFDFGDSAVDQAFSIVVCVYADNVASRQIIGKWDVNNAREWRFFLDASGYPTIQLYDESIDKYIGRQDQTALVTTGWKVLIATYDGSGICAGCKIYLDGVQVDDADYTDAGYVAMEAVTANLMVGALKNAAAYSEYFDGKMTWIGVTAKELSADEAWSLTQRLKGVLGI